MTTILGVHSVVPVPHEQDAHWLWLHVTEATEQAVENANVTFHHGPIIAWGTSIGGDYMSRGCGLIWLRDCNRFVDPASQFDKVARLGDLPHAAFIGVFNKGDKPSEETLQSVVQRARTRAWYVLSSDIQKEERQNRRLGVA